MNRTPEPRNREERIAQMRERFNEVVTRPQHRRQIEEDLSRSRHDILAVNGEHRVPYDQSWKDAVIKFKETQRFGLDLLKLQVTAMRSNDARDLGKYFGPVNALRDVPPEIEDMHGIYNTTNNVMKSKYPYPLEKFY